jgi:hypothetical protein
MEESMITNIRPYPVRTDSDIDEKEFTRTRTKLFA